MINKIIKHLLVFSLQGLVGQFKLLNFSLEDAFSQHQLSLWQKTSSVSSFQIWKIDCAYRCGLYFNIRQQIITWVNLHIWKFEKVAIELPTLAV